MTLRTPHLLWLKTFEAVARHASFTAAGQELGLTQAAVSQHVKALETQLGCKLFVRGTRRLELTDMGKAYIQPVKKAIDDLVLSTQGLFGSRMQRTITVRAPISHASLVIAPRLKEFRRGNPGIGVRLISTIWADAIPDSEVDVDIRLGHGFWPERHSELLSRECVVAVCSPYTAGAIRRTEDLLKHSLIRILGFDDLWARYFQATDGSRLEAQEVITVDTSLSAIEIVTAGGGVALVMQRFARYLETQGRIAIPLERSIAIDQSHWFVGSSDNKRLQAETNLFREWLRSISVD